MIAASTYLPSASSSTTAASSIHGIGAQSLVSALRSGRTAVSGTSLGPDFSIRRRASSLVSPAGSGTSVTEEEAIGSTLLQPGASITVVFAGGFLLRRALLLFPFLFARAPEDALHRVVALVTSVLNQRPFSLGHGNLRR